VVRDALPSFPTLPAAAARFPGPSPTLFCAMALFFLFLSLSIVMFVLLEIHMCARPRRRRPSNDSTGSDMRRWFHLMLFVAVLGRSCSLLVLWIWKPIDPFEGEETLAALWIQSVAITMPDVLFMSAYSFLIYFWARLLYIAMEWSAIHLRLGFLVSNVMAFLAFLGLVLVYSLRSTPDSPAQFFRSCSILLALCYALLLGSLVHYGRKFTMELQRDAIGEKLVSRVFNLSIVCSSVFLAKILYEGFKASHTYSGADEIGLADYSMYFVTEVLIFLTELALAVLMILTELVLYCTDTS
jgi:hypothetical protein